MCCVEAPSEIYHVSKPDACEAQGGDSPEGMSPSGVDEASRHSEQHCSEDTSQGRGRKRHGKKRRERFHRLVDRLVERTWDDATLDLRAEPLPQSIVRSEESFQKFSGLVSRCVAKKIAEDCAESTVHFHPDVPPIIFSV
mmetsp:Transcript_55079/g.154585  ORF Transcript_55079/g.154585 Transcript_55079/m.154585 type:complete len:140 (+) Transcript_55079:162-581(+)|eukprot:CAMPEP_0176233768 /NCGR_PEP_ID=MMETSP0121_2-20121125/25990_1 /TAXON_ID=160619 /ORGANISM="Kryptoperidinium foliaceum, Strain CCMP 1326" /LENGTH=139 /DNA_ID=CAMNT_0017573163 /DNA_START=153 /DNA_END=572 /DNA_ORIENTATION=-